MDNTISYGTTHIVYKVEYRPRKTLAIEVHPDSSVWVKAPISASREAIQSKVEKRAPWIAKQQRYFNGKPNKIELPEWVSGANIYYLGRQYRLEVLAGDSNVKMAGKYLQVFVNDKTDTTRISNLVNAWYLKRARIKFEERLKRLTYILENEKLVMNALMIRKLDKRWGSCTKKKNIILNADLIKLPIHCIDYVLTHEICHLRHHNHSSQFWAMLRKYSPDWEKTKHRLEEFER